VIPGGVEEGLTGHENAYRLVWRPDRTGFARIAIQAQVPVYPCFIQNGEEMKFNPLFWLMNKIKLTKLYDYSQRQNIKLVSWFIHNLAAIIWVPLSLLAIPIPVKATIHLGAPIAYDCQQDTLEDYVLRCKTELQALIDKHQPQGLNYTRAIGERFFSRTKKPKN
ncbi:unnamed protein product, partial [Didymodactylos carnosus]